MFVAGTTQITQVSKQQKNRVLGHLVYGRTGKTIAPAARIAVLVS